MISLIISKLDIGFLGIIHSYHFSYFVSLGLLTGASAILWASDQRRLGPLQGTQMVLLIMFIWLTPVILGNAPLWSDHIYYLWGQSKYINLFGHLNPADASLWYHNWPGFFIYQSTFSQIMNIEPLGVFAYLGTLIILLCNLLPLYVLFDTIMINKNYIWIGLWLFFISYWMGDLYFSPQGVAFFIFLLTMAIISKLWQKGHTSNPALALIIIILIPTITITHYLTAIALAGIIGIWSFTKKRSDYLLGNYFVIFAVILVLWAIYGSAAFFENNILNYLIRAFSFLELFNFKTLSETTTVTPPIQITSTIQILILVIFFFLGFLGILKSRVHRWFFDNPMILGMIPVALMFGLQLYSDTARYRIFVFTFPFICYFGTKLVSGKFTNILLTACILLTIPLHIMAENGAASAARINRDDTLFWNYFNTYVSKAYVIYDYMAWPLIYPNINNVELRNLLFFEGVLKLKNNDRPQYILINDRARHIYRLYMDEPEYLLEMQNELMASVQYATIYANPTVIILFKDS